MSGSARATAARAARILVVDDDFAFRHSTGKLLERQGHEVVLAESPSAARDRLVSGSFDLVLADLAMRGEGGLGLLRQIQKAWPGLPVIVVTGFGSVSSAVEAMRAGAEDYLSKPVEPAQLRLAVRRAVAGRLWRRTEAPPDTSAAGNHYEGIVSQDLRMTKVFELIDAVARTPTTVLITGESGTGKSLVARTIHARSSRSRGPFVEVPCGGLPETLLAGELFGHVRGAFTDAVADKEGKFAAAEGGTIFLDEIATASPALQVKLLRVLQERRFEPVGSNRTHQVDARVLLATNHDLWDEVQAGRFREDLYYRIHVVNIALPPLRERLSDISLLVGHFLRRFAARTGKAGIQIAPKAMDLLRAYPWPGNVRELENCIERAVVLCRGRRIGPDDLPPAVTGFRPSASAESAPREQRTLVESLAESEREIISRALRDNEGNRRRTARQLGINRATLYKKMKRHGLFG